MREPSVGVVSGPSHRVEFGDSGVGLARGAGGSVAVDAQDALVLADIEARLTKEVRGFVLALNQFGCRTQAISKEVPDSAQFCKLVAIFLGLVSFQLANALGKDLDKPIFFDDGRQYLTDLGLSLNELFREVNLDDHRFLAVAFVDQKPAQVDGRAEAGQQ